MKKTVLITGSSSGIGKETAIYFAEKGWNVIATMRHPEKRQTGLEKREGIVLRHLDVTDSASIKDAVKFTVNTFKGLDVLVNNAGYPLMGPFEASKIEQVRKQIETNVIGLMEVVREALPVMRKQGRGTIINVASVGGRIGFPLYSFYNATKWGVEGFSEALQYELRGQGIKVRIIEPGIIRTDFYGRSEDPLRREGLTAYDDLVGRVAPKIRAQGEKGSHPIVIAKLIYKAANAKGWKLRYHAGSNSGLVLSLRKIMPDGVFIGTLGRFMGAR